ncbi:T9SS type B sorting domain-containing protein [Aureivirga marina]|uniref:T9SS type B sorting domain-containing protein n=1 Tax=Aureivirga marina TaxID=1182451 RepID=UPI001E2AE2F6|nr:gliding motility-associated C-terminal domain-containing protein [Aureivirga marina]
MKKKYFLNYLLLGIFIITQTVFAQKEANNWFFGYGAGITFETEPPSAIDVPINYSMLEGCSSISNANGETLFFTNGVTVYNRNYDVMLNGEDLSGASSSSQSAIIIKAINSNRYYYIFTVDEIQDYPDGDGLRYSLVDMELDNGLGGIVETEKNVLLNFDSYEKLTAIYNEEANEYWVATIKIDSNEILAYKVDDLGVNPVPVVSHMNEINDEPNIFGYMKFSPNGKKMAASLWQNGTKLFDFDKETGSFSNQITIESLSNQPPDGQILLYNYGLSFSPNSEFLYLTYWNTVNLVSQFNINYETEEEIINSRYDLIFHEDGYHYMSALQIGPDSKIYIVSNGDNSIHVIHNPNESGESASLELNYISLAPNKKSLSGLPTFVSSIFEDYGFKFHYDEVCFGTATNFTFDETEVSNILWDFGDENSSNNTSTEQNPVHEFTTSGDFLVKLTFDKDGESFTLKNTVTVYENLIIEPIDEFSFLGEELIDFDLLNHVQENSLEVNWSNFNIYFYTSELDAELDQNRIDSIQTVDLDTTFYFRIENSLANCFDTNSFLLKVKLEEDILEEETSEEELINGLFIPEGFSPNGNGVNDLFEIKDVFDLFPNYQIDFYDRWGSLIYTDKNGNPWNGQLKGDKSRAPAGVYFFVLHFNKNNLKPYQGRLYLNR